MNTLDFEEPIAITLRIEKIATIGTIIGKSIYVEGELLESDTPLNDKRICFYCPEPLEHLLRQIGLEKRDIIQLRYLGRIRRKGTQVRDFFVERTNR